MLDKLWSVGITGGLWAWFKEYLTNRFQKVSINNSLSDTLPVISGVPQGSILGPILFLIYMNDISSSIWHSRLLQFADDTKCFKSISSISDQAFLQDDLNTLCSWATSLQLKFNLSKCTQVSFESGLPTSYDMLQSALLCTDIYRDLGLMVSNDLTWDKHYEYIIARAYKILGLIRRTFSMSHYPLAKAKLYTTLVRSQLIYCTQLWRPHLIKDILNIERVQRRATKYILNDYVSNYKTRLLKLKLLPLMYFLEIQDIMFVIKSLKFPTNNFNIRDYISFSTTNTRSSSGHKLLHMHHSSNTNRHFFFHRIPRLWNSIPVIDLTLSVITIKIKLADLFWSNFVQNFDVNDHCTLHFLCPCSKCYSLPPRVNFSTL